MILRHSFITGLFPLLLTVLNNLPPALLLRGASERKFIDVHKEFSNVPKNLDVTSPGRDHLRSRSLFCINFEVETADRSLCVYVQRRAYVI